MNGENNLNPNQTKSNSSGYIIAVLVVLAVLVLAGFYFWDRREARNDVLESIERQSESDDAASIEADLDATDVDNLDSEFNAS